MNLFVSAVGNPALITEVVNEIRSAASQVGVTLSDDPLQLVRLASENAAFREAVRSRLARVAAARGLEFTAESPASTEGAATALGKIQTLQKDNPTQIPVSMPIALLFVGAALMFAPSVFRSTGGTLFGEGEIGAIEGIEPFK